MASSNQLLLFEPPSSWKRPILSDLPEWGRADRVCIDVETKDEDLGALGPGTMRKGSYVCGYSVAIENGPNFYLPIRHGLDQRCEDNFNPDQVLTYMRTNAAKFSGDLVGANLAYDLDWMTTDGIVFPHVKWFRDVLLADPCINELHRSYSLKNVGERHGIQSKDERELLEALAAYGYTGKKAKGGIWRVPGRYAGIYAEMDTVSPLRILRSQEKLIAQNDLQSVWDLESRVLPVLVKMRRRGVRVDEDRLQQIDDWAYAEQWRAINAANQMHNWRKLETDDITRSEVIAQVLMSIDISVPSSGYKKNKHTGLDEPKFSVRKDFTEGLKHPIGKHLRHAKKMATLRSTFIEGVRAHLYNGRLHSSFNQMRGDAEGWTSRSGDNDNAKGAAYGRLSAEHPNLQNQPARDPDICPPIPGKKWRSIYLPEEGATFGSLDYSQQEPRHAVSTAVKAGEYGLIRISAYHAALEAARQYRTNPKMDFHDMMTRIVHGEDALERVGKVEFKRLRGHCKEIFLGLSYGMGGAKLCMKLGLPTAFKKMEWGLMEIAGPEGQALIDKFNARVPFVRATADAAKKIAEARGFVKTILGRHCHFEERKAGSYGTGRYDFTHKSFNRIIQGSSADQTKQALIDMDAAGYFLQLQVHDEIDGSFADRAEAERAATIMENCVSLAVPSKVDVECGPSWGEAA